MKVIEYYGINIEPPEWAKYIAMDSNMMVYAYNAKPYMSAVIDSWIPSHRKYHSYLFDMCPYLLKTERESIDWKLSLVEVCK